MRQDVIADWICRIPDTMEIVAHDIKEVHMVNCFEIKPSQIPVTRRYCERCLICDRLFANCVFEFFEENCEFLPVVRVATSIRCSWVLLPNWLARMSQSTLTRDYPVKVHAIKSVFPEETE